MSREIKAVRGKTWVWLAMVCGIFEVVLFTYDNFEHVRGKYIF